MGCLYVRHKRLRDHVPFGNSRDVLERRAGQILFLVTANNLSTETRDMMGVFGFEDFRPLPLAHGVC